MDRYEYTREDLLKYTSWKPNTINQAVSRDGLKIGNLAEVAIWLSANATPKIRAEMARNLLPAVFGFENRSSSDTKALYNQSQNLDLLLEIFKRADAPRRARASKISKNRPLS